MATRGMQVRVKMTPEMVARIRKVSKVSGIPQLHLYSVSMALGLRLLELALTGKPSAAGAGIEAALAIGDEVAKHKEELKPSSKRK